MKATATSERTLLVVDDDEHTRNLLRDLCEASGYQVRSAEDGEQALDSLSALVPDLILLDLMMPRKDGFTVLKEIRDHATLSDLPVIILTATGDMDGKIRGMELGADDYVTKPFKLIELQSRISSALLVRDYRRRLQAAEEELAQLRALDPVTGAGTYSQLKASLDGEIARSKRYGRPASALMIGIEEFQNVRFRLGREKCDDFVGHIAEAIRSALRGADRLFRLEADEFVVLLPETDLRGARMAAERLVKLVNTLTAEGREGAVVEAKVRVGGAVYPNEGVQTGEDLLREANRSYRTVRAAGADRVIFGVS